MQQLTLCLLAAISDDEFRRRRRPIDQGEMAWLRNFQSQRRSLEAPNESPEQKPKDPKQR